MFVFGATVDTAFLPGYCTAMNLTAPRPLLLNNATTKPIIFTLKFDKTIIDVKQYLLQTSFDNIQRLETEKRHFFVQVN